MSATKKEMVLGELYALLLTLGQDGQAWVQGTNEQPIYNQGDDWDTGGDAELGHCVYGGLAYVDGAALRQSYYEADGYEEQGEELNAEDLDLSEVGQAAREALTEAGRRLFSSRIRTGMMPNLGSLTIGANQVQGWQDRTYTTWPEVKAVILKAIEMVEARHDA